MGQGHWQCHAQRPLNHICPPFAEREASGMRPGSQRSKRGAGLSGSQCFTQESESSVAGEVATGMAFGPRGQGWSGAPSPCPPQPPSSFLCRKPSLGYHFLQRKPPLSTEVQI